MNHLTKELKRILPLSATPISPATDMSFTGKVALITGASKGIGKATALRFAKDGASVVINYNSDSKSADALVQQIGVDKALAVQADVSKVADIEKLVKATVDKFKKIDILIPCAGMLPMSPLEATTEELFDQIFGLNVKGPYFLCQVRRVSILLGVVHSYTSRKLPHTWEAAPTSS